LTTYNILLLIPLAFMYATWNQLKEDDDTVSKTIKTMRKEINTIMKRIFWIMSLVQIIIIVYIYVRHNLFEYMSEVIWDYGITIEQIFTVEEKIKYLDNYMNMYKEYLENDDKAKADENNLIEKTVADAQELNKEMHPKINKDEIREMTINAMDNIRRSTIINEKDMRERIIKEINNVSISDMKEYITDIINKEFKDRLDKASEKLKEEIQRLYEERKRDQQFYPFLKNVLIIANITRNVLYMYKVLPIAYRLYRIYTGYPNNYVGIYGLVRMATSAIMHINTLLPLKSIQSKLRYMYKILEFIGFRKGDRPIYGS
jgi:hypothetical protein